MSKLTVGDALGSFKNIVDLRDRYYYKGINDQTWNNKIESVKNAIDQIHVFFPHLQLDLDLLEFQSICAAIQQDSLISKLIQRMKELTNYMKSTVEQADRIRANTSSCNHD